MKIYLAGAIRKNDWRHDIVDGLRDGFRDSAGDHYCQDNISSLRQFPVLERSIFGVHDYVGPYFVSDDHGCGHRPEAHGLADCGYDFPIVPRQIIARLCLEAIDRADLFFCWFDDPDHDYCGTLCELGYAANSNCVICVGFGEYDFPAVDYMTDTLSRLDYAKYLYRQFWFAANLAGSVRYGRWAREELQEELCRLAPPKRFAGYATYAEYLASDHWVRMSSEAKERAGQKCQLCNGDGVLHTHHRTYVNLGSEEEQDLIVLCAECHAKFHERPKFR